MARLCHWFFSLDPPTRAAVISAAATVLSIAIAFVGVLLTIRSNRVRAREDQLITLRRETYLEACDVTAEAVQFLVRLADPNVTLSGLPVPAKLSGVFGKLHVLANQTTLTAVMAYMNAFLDEYVGRAKLKASYEMNASKIAEAKQKIALSNGEDRTALQRQILELTIDNFSLTGQLLIRSAKVPDKLVTHATAVTLAFRKELNLPLDEKWYREIEARNLQLNKDRVKPFLDLLDEYLATIEAARPQPRP